MRTPLPLDPNPLQPWLLAYTMYVIDVSYSYLYLSILLIFSYSNLYLTFYKVLCMVWITTIASKSGLKMHLEKFKNEKSFVPWHTPSMLLMSLILPFYPELCMVSTATKALKSGLKMCLARFRNWKFSYPGKGDIPSLGSPSHAASALFP